MERAYVALIYSKPKEARDNARETIAIRVPFMTEELLLMMEKYVLGEISWEQYIKTDEAVIFYCRQYDYIDLKKELYPFIKDSIIKFDDPDNSTKELED